MIKGITKIFHMLCFVLINSILLNLLCVLLRGFLKAILEKNRKGDKAVAVVVAGDPGPAKEGPAGPQRGGVPAVPHLAEGRHADSTGGLRLPNA